MRTLIDGINTVVSVVLGFILAGVVLGFTFLGWILSTAFGLVAIVVTLLLFLIFGLVELCGFKPKPYSEMTPKERHKDRLKRAKRMARKPPSQL